MSAFGTSTDKIMETGLGSSTMSLGVQVSPHPPTTENRRLKIAAAVVFVLLALIVAGALVGIYLSRPPPPPEVFTVYVKDPDAERSIRLQVKYDMVEKLEYTMSPDVQGSGDIIYTMKDFSRGLVAHKDFLLGLCMVTRLNDTEDSARHRAKAFKGTAKHVQLAATEHFLILDGSIHPEVLGFTTSWRIARYCGNLAAHWMVGQLPSDLPPATTTTTVAHTESTTVKANIVEEPAGEEEKMQILSESNTGEASNTEHELPPEDPKLIQEAEKSALLEEKSSILAEKLESPIAEEPSPMDESEKDLNSDEKPLSLADPRDDGLSLPRIFGEKPEDQPLMEDKIPSILAGELESRRTEEEKAADEKAAKEMAAAAAEEEGEEEEDVKEIDLDSFRDNQEDESPKSMLGIFGNGGLGPVVLDNRTANEEPSAFAEKLARMEQESSTSEGRRDGKSDNSDDHDPEKSSSDDKAISFIEKLALLEDKTLMEEKTEDIKTTADEKSTVQKAPHMDEMTILEEDLKDISSPLQIIPAISESPEDGNHGGESNGTHQNGAEPNESFGFDNTQPPGDHESSTTEDKHAGHDHGTLTEGGDGLIRRKRDICTIRCWYYLRNMKGYKRCVYRCL